jgi:hypothetical protein
MKTSKLQIKTEKLVGATQHVIANAGPDQYIYYPTKTCILNGSNSHVLDDNQIIRWQWSKSELSPSIGVSKFWFLNLENRL